MYLAFLSRIKNERKRRFHPQKKLRIKYFTKLIQLLRYACEILQVYRYPIFNFCIQIKKFKIVFHQDNLKITNSSSRLPPLP